MKQEVVPDSFPKETNGMSQDLPAVAFRKGNESSGAFYKRQISFLDIGPQSSSAPSLFYVMVFVVLALLLYAYATHVLTIEEQPLKRRCTELHEEKERLQKINHELSEMVASLSDPAADEYALITELGKIPKGSYKIVFKKSDIRAATPTASLSTEKDFVENADIKAP